MSVSLISYISIMLNLSAVFIGFVMSVYKPFMVKLREFNIFYEEIVLKIIMF